MKRIVVGVDGSEPSRAALLWAVEEAKLRDAELDVVFSWDFPVMATSDPIMVIIPERTDLESSARSMADQLVAEFGLAGSGLTYRVSTPEGRPGEALVEKADGAEMLVVGSHGAGALKELFTGSVSNFVTHHSPCPVVLVRAPS